MIWVLCGTAFLVSLCGVIMVFSIMLMPSVLPGDNTCDDEEEETKYDTYVCQGKPTVVAHDWKTTPPALLHVAGYHDVDRGQFCVVCGVVLAGGAPMRGWAPNSIILHGGASPSGRGGLYVDVTDADPLPVARRCSSLEAR